MKSFAFAATCIVAVAMAVVAASSQSAKYTVGEFQRDVQAVIEADRRLPATDMSLWPRIADITRRLARNIGIKAANDALEKSYANAPSRKLYSKVWAVLPGSTIQGLQEHIYRGDYDTYGPKTKSPQIRRDLLAVVTAVPADPFIEFAHYALGDFEKGINARPNSPIKDVLHHAFAFNIVGALVTEAYAKLLSTGKKGRKPYIEDIDRKLTFLNQNSKLYDNKPLATVVPKFTERAALAKSHFDRVIETPKSASADDAAYLASWLAYHQGHYDEALRYLKLSMTIGNGDYKNWGAVKQTVRILEKSAPVQQYSILKSDTIISKQVPLWYVAARSAYRNFDYGLSKEISQAALTAFNISPGGLPVTTDRERIESVLSRFPGLRKDWKASLHMGETAYLLAASQEIQNYVQSLASAAQTAPDQLSARVKAIVVKYSKLLDQPAIAALRLPGGPLAIHKDLRQGVHLIDATLASVPNERKFSELREWLHYRKVRIVAVFAPATVGRALEAMERELPASSLMDDALAEQIFAESYMIGNMSAAKVIFDKLLSKYPNGNAVDNAHSWMSIGYRCAGQVPAAQAIEREIIRRFPNTRHARYTRERLSNSGSGNSSGDTCFYRGAEVEQEGQRLASAEPAPAEIRAGDLPRRFKTFQNTDILGHDIGILRQTSPDDCLSACNANARCAAYSYDKWNKVCFLKDAAPELVVDARAITAVYEGSPAPAMASRPIVMQRFRSRSFPGRGDLQETVAAFDACETRCSQTNSCIAFTFVKSSQQCRMFKVTGEYFPNSDTDSGAKVSAK